MKKSVFFLFLALSTGFVAAQQEQQYTQFMFNKQAFNPAYVGSHTSSELTAIYRQQWLGLDGAPGTQVLSYNLPLANQTVGLGANLVRNNIGISTSTALDLAYCYRFEVRRGHLGIGVQASLKHFRQNWADNRLHGTQDLTTDDAIPAEPRRKMVPNFGLGLYYNEEKFYCGFSLPRLVSSSIDFAEDGSTLSREVKHFYLMGGINIGIREAFVLKPQVLVKYALNAPIDADLNCSALFSQRFLAGLTYRTGAGETSTAGESLDFLAGVQATSKIYFGLSYDIGLTKLRKYHNGSIEAVVRYGFYSVEDFGMVPPRPK